jgi:uncharacterized membrane protein
MQRSEQIARAGFASAMIALGAVGFVFRDFALVWGPVPRWFPSSPALALVCAAVALAAGVALLIRRTAAAASLVSFVYVGLWWWLLKVPEVIGAPRTELTWLDCGMFGILLAGAWTLFADLDGRTFLGGERGMRLARVLFGISLIPTGLSHFVYLSLTAPLVPSWLPFHLAWAYFTGACHLAAGLGVLFGVLPALAAGLEAAMLGLFTILVWIPIVIAAPGTRGNWTEIWISWALTVAAAVVAVHVRPRTRRSAVIPSAALQGSRVQ